MWQEVWNTVVVEFSDMPDATQITRITLRLLVAAILGAFWATRGRCRVRAQVCERI